MKNLPIGLQIFQNFHDLDCVYVDKTKMIHKLVKQQGIYYFLSRPRRFGKSLLISTMRELFSGNKELFKEIWIYNNTGNFGEVFKTEFYLKKMLKKY